MNSPHRIGRGYRARRDQGGPDKILGRRPSLAIIARLVIDQSRRRSHFLPGAIFEDPQWLMTLDLFVAGEEGRQVSVSNLCCASGVPPTTALRHIRHLQAQGIFERVSHPRDRRISHVRLAATARSQVARYLASIGSSLTAGHGFSAPVPLGQTAI